MINNRPYDMPLAVLFIGGVLPVVLGPLIKERNWLYEIQFRMILKIILKKKGTSAKLQAASFKLDSWCRI
jgi:hypothetical protein